MRRNLMLILLTLFGLFVLYTILSSATGRQVPGILTPITTLTGFSFGLLHASERLGWKKALLLLAFVFGVSLFFESLGVATGLVYGRYHYTEKLGPKFLGLVPYLIAIAWFMMMYPSFVMAEWLAPSAWTGAKRLLAISALGGLVMTSWDVVMDPLMVRGQNWVWEVNGAFFGVPLQNYWGWWLTVFTTFVFYLLSTRNRPSVKNAGFDRLALVAFMITGYGNTLSALIAGLGGPALAGFFALTPWIVLSWLKTSASNLDYLPSRPENHG